MKHAVMYEDEEEEEEEEPDGQGQVQRAMVVGVQ